MEGLMSADGGYPDFSVLEEVLLPPFMSSPWEELQYRVRPRGVTREHRNLNVNRAEETPCRQTAARGRQSRANSSRFSEAEPCPAHTNKWPYSQHTESCMVPVLERTALCLLEESVKSIPKSEKKAENDRNGRHRINNYNQTSVLRTSCTKSQSQAMEVLNLINLECNQLTRGRREDESEPQSKDHPEINNNVLELERSCCLPDGENPVGEGPANSKRFTIDSEPLCKECQTRTSCDGQTSTGDPSQENSGTEESSGTVRCLQRTPRKQKTPMRSVEKTDPNFQGIEFQMHLCSEEEKYDDYRLIVTSFYSSGGNWRKMTKFRPRMKSTSLSSGSDDEPAQSTAARSKRCASCKTQKTPLWRDAEDGTPLCNACGIRYKKYGVRCGECWNIPKKDGKSCSRYCRCGRVFRPLI